MAENECGMQRNLNLLNEYCNCNGLRVNIRKTKIMVFSRSKTRLRTLPNLNLAIWILIWFMTMFIWVFVLIGMAHSLKLKKTPSS